MELEHRFQQPNFIAAFQLVIVGWLLASGLVEDGSRRQAFVDTVSKYIVSFIPTAVLIYVLYKVSHLF